MLWLIKSFFVFQGKLAEMHLLYLKLLQLDINYVIICFLLFFFFLRTNMSHQGSSYDFPALVW